MTSLRISIKKRAYSTIIAFSGRVGLYLAGFVFNFMIANALTPAEFGMFSTTMAASELMTIFLTLGSSLLVYRSSYELKSVPIKSIFGILMVGLLIISPTHFIVANYFPDWSSYTNYAAMTAFGLSLSGLLLQSLRALDWTNLVIYEPLFRQIFYICAILSVTLGSVSGTIGLHTAFLCMVSGTMLSGALILGLSLARVKLNYQSPRASFHEYFSLLFASVCSYVNRKGDILLLSLLVSSSAVAGIKIALLISEIPFQFVQNLYIQSASLFISPHNDQLERRASMTQLTIWCGVISVSALVALPIFSGFVWPKLNFAAFVPLLLVYYFLRSLLLPVEQRLVMSNRPRLLLATSLIGALLKISLLAVAVSRFGLAGLYAYPLVGLAEIAVVEIVFRKSLRESYLKWCFGTVQR